MSGRNLTRVRIKSGEVRGLASGRFADALRLRGVCGLISDAQGGMFF